MRQTKNLINRVQQVVTVGSVPDWLKARVSEIPAVQERVRNLLQDITEEAEQGGLSRLTRRWVP